MTLALFGQCLTVGGLALLLFAELRPGAPAIFQWIFKPIASLGFVLAGVGAGATETPYGRALLAAFVLSLLGDVLLIPRGAKAAFLAGLVAFLLGHVGFASAFVIRGVAWGGTAVALGLLGVPAFLVGRYFVQRAPEKLRVPVMAYVTVITVMVALSIGTHLASPRALIPVAATLFYASDLFVARQRFVEPGSINRLVGLPLYYGAQLLFALTIIR